MPKRHSLLTAWREFEPEKPPFILPGDEVLLAEPRLWNSHQWRDYVADQERGNPTEAGKLCLGLLPMPVVGNLRTASIFVLMVNPGAQPHDLFGESEVPEYRTELLATLRQANGFDGLLDPRFAWDGRYGYWERKLSKLFERLAQGVESYGVARQQLQTKMAALELVPYHSTRYALPNRLLKQLKSVELMRSYLKDVLIPRARAGDALVIIARAANSWGAVPKSKNIVTYSGSAARGAHLTPDSPGGKAILRFLKTRG